MRLRSSSRLWRAVRFPAAAALFVATVFASLRYGALPLDAATVWSAVWDYDHTDHGQVVVRELRVHRTVIGTLAGACLAVAGALTQGVTRNPLGAPGILGINAGAALAVVGAIYVVGITTPGGYVWFAFVGALAATLLVYAIASAGAGGATPVKLALAGAIITALAGSWTAALLLLDVATLDQARFWLAGSIAGRGTAEATLLMPVIGVSLVAALLIGRQVNALSMGAQLAAGLGQRVAAVRAVASVLVVALAGSAVALAGPVAFVGLAVPHIVRSVVGPDYRLIIGYSMLLGPCLLLGADVVGRVIVAPSELQVGIVSAALGAPFLVYLVRRSRMAEL
ncbi:FecCD family ABC transporter permease [Candidatus Poriferisodalis sp.]|uniref:FecCD family ABC transporter permease n=1 Tax=Candidatus Poriferisodalis sp. TaxID=3101277 RepID=UPI003B0157FC